MPHLTLADIASRTLPMAKKVKLHESWKPGKSEGAKPLEDKAAEATAEAPLKKKRKTLYGNSKGMD